mmetsp:Transcript_68074/g.148450  ORF Transcript_68074/g.148450 Transcript_68074/m.148450 type:complete len:125 (+) Transcript_68074:923-1297(+)
MKGRMRGKLASLSLSFFVFVSVHVSRYHPHRAAHSLSSLSLSVHLALWANMPVRRRQAYWWFDPLPDQLWCMTSACSVQFWQTWNFFFLLGALRRAAKATCSVWHFHLPPIIIFFCLARAYRRR